jgi:hypothetical protein
MAITVKKITLWRREVEDRSGALASVLDPLAGAGAGLQVVMGYRLRGTASGVVEVYPVSGKKHTAAAQTAGLSAASIPTLLVQGDDRPGLGRDFAKAVAEAGINMNFLVAMVVGRKYSSVVGFDSEVDATQAAGLIKKAAAKKRK